MPGAVAFKGAKFSDDDTVGTGSSTVFVNGFGIARIADFTTGHVVQGHGFYPPAPIVGASGSVFADNLPVAAKGDKHAVHCDPPHPSPDCHDGTLIEGSPDVFTA